ncbi:MAG: cyclase family protein [Actinomycetota bacterium]
MLVDLSFPIEDGMPTLPGVLPEARVSAILDHDASRERYQGKAEFYPGRVDIPGNTGTYLDAPFHRHRDREDLAAIQLERLANLPGILVEAGTAASSVAIDLQPQEIRGRAVLLRTGWDRRWGTDSYWEPDPYLSPEAIDLLIEGGAALVGVDWNNVDDTSDPARPAHTRLLEAGVLILERLRGLEALPREGFTVTAVPPAIVRGASFPVRAFADVPG